MIGFLILHYKTTRETIACVDSIRALDFNRTCYHILVTDNGSDNGSYEHLAALYQADQDVTVMTTGQNLGFSSGNNAGWAAFPHREQVEFLVVCNSDVVFEQGAFVQTLLSQTSFDVLGPDIRVRRGSHVRHSSPLPPIATRRDTVGCNAAVRRARLAAAQNGASTPLGAKLHYPGWQTFLYHVHYLISSHLYKLRQQFHNPAAENALLQGACLIFSARYLKRYERLFDPAPFLYYEELLLWLKAQRDGLVMRYDPSLYVLHLEGCSTNTLKSDKMQRFLFVQEQMYRSEQLVLRVFTQDFP